MRATFELVSHQGRAAYSCQWCGHHLHPTVGTPFEQTRTLLQLWFYAIHLFTTTRHGVSAKELQHQPGMTYKTTRRMAGLIRQHMADLDGNEPLGGEVVTQGCAKPTQGDPAALRGEQRGDRQRCHTDELNSYRGLGAAGYHHATVNHGANWLSTS